jgi:hypothetical protein
MQAVREIGQPVLVENENTPQSKRLKKLIIANCAESFFTVPRSIKECVEF